MGEANFAREVCEKIQEEDGKIILEGFTEVICSKSWWSLCQQHLPYATQQPLGRQQDMSLKKMAKESAKEFALGVIGKRPLEFVSLYRFIHYSTVDVSAMTLCPPGPGAITPFETCHDLSWQEFFREEERLPCYVVLNVVRNFPLTEALLGGACSFFSLSGCLLLAPGEALEISAVSMGRLQWTYPSCCIG